jgi:hypothetical protein
VPELPHPLAELNFASVRLGHMGSEGKLLNQSDSRLEDMGLISKFVGSGLCTTACAVNALLTLVNPYLKNAVPVDRFELAKRFVELAEKQFPGSNPRVSLNLENIAQPLKSLSRELGLEVEVSIKIIDDNGSLGIGDFYDAKGNEIILLSLWTAAGTHAVMLSTIDPSGRRASIVDPNNPSFVQNALILPGNFNGMSTERIVYRDPRIPAHPANGSILKVVRVRLNGNSTHLREEYAPKDVRVLRSKSDIRSFENQTSRPPVFPVVTTTGLSANQLVRELSARLRKFRDASSPAVKVDFSKEVDLIYFLFLPQAENLAQGLLNQHQTQKSNGSYGPEARRRNENLLMDFDLGNDSKSNQIRPKSTYLNIKNDKNYGWYSDDPVAHYGGVGAVLKSSLLERSIWSAGDSFHILSKAKDSSDGTQLRLFGGFDETSLPKSEGLYLEGLTFGDIGLTDIDYLLVVNESMVSSLKHLGLPIYYMEAKRDKGRFIFSKGRRLL